MNTKVPLLRRRPACDHPYQHYMAMDYVEGLE